MSDDIVISVRGLGKKYTIGRHQERYQTFRDALVNSAKAPFRRLTQKSADQSTNEFWALKDVSFDVRRGEVIGIIGRNGAGKSTLLKILSRITTPTEGEVDIYGRVGSLLEVGTGFHPELTGRENIFLSGSILGMRKREIEEKFDEIVKFSEIEKFIDTPVKRYSSGMYVRLAFAVAAHLEAEILIVDEVLAVGDAQFQKKCMGKMGDVAKQGRTVLFVSHNMGAVRNLCPRAILLSNGNIVEDGASAYVINTYLGSGREDKAERIWDDPSKAPGNEVFRLHSVCMRDESGIKVSKIGSDHHFEIEIEYWNLHPNITLGATIILFNQEGTCVLSSVSNHEEWYGRSRPTGLYRSTCHIPGSFLNEGRYSVTVLIFAGNYSSIHKENECIEFEIYDTGGVRGDYFGGWSGVVRPLLKWNTKHYVD